MAPKPRLRDRATGTPAGEQSATGNADPDNNERVTQRRKARKTAARTAPQARIQMSSAALQRAQSVQDDHSSVRQGLSLEEIYANRETEFLHKYKTDINRLRTKLPNDQICLSVQQLVSPANADRQWEPEVMVQHVGDKARYAFCAKIGMYQRCHPDADNPEFYVGKVMQSPPPPGSDYRYLCTERRFISSWSVLDYDLATAQRIADRLVTILNAWPLTLDQISRIDPTAASDSPGLPVATINAAHLTHIAYCMERGDSRTRLRAPLFDRSTGEFVMRAHALVLDSSRIEQFDVKFPTLEDGTGPTAQHHLFFFPVRMPPNLQFVEDVGDGRDLSITPAIEGEEETHESCLPRDLGELEPWRTQLVQHEKILRCLAASLHTALLPHPALDDWIHHWIASQTGQAPVFTQLASIARRAALNGQAIQPSRAAKDLIEDGSGRLPQLWVSSLDQSRVLPALNAITRAYCSTGDIQQAWLAGAEVVMATQLAISHGVPSQAACQCGSDVPSIRIHHCTQCVKPHLCKEMRDAYYGTKSCPSCFEKLEPWTKKGFKARLGHMLGNVGIHSRDEAQLVDWLSRDHFREPRSTDSSKPSGDYRDYLCDRWRPLPSDIHRWNLPSIDAKRPYGLNESGVTAVHTDDNMAVTAQGLNYAKHTSLPGIMQVISEFVKMPRLDGKGRTADEKTAILSAATAQLLEANGREEVGGDLYGCVCGDTGDDGRKMIQCSKCEAWQHFICMRLPDDDDWDDKEYFCEQCAPQDHEKLLSAMVQKLSEKALIIRSAELRKVRHKFAWKQSGRTGLQPSQEAYDQFLLQCRSGKLAENDKHEDYPWNRTDFGCSISPQASVKKQEAIAALGPLVKALEEEFAVELPKARDGCPWLGHPDLMPPEWSWPLAYAVMTVRLDRLREDCNGLDTTEENPSSLFLEFVFQQCARQCDVAACSEASKVWTRAEKEGFKARYADLLGLPLVFDCWDSLCVSLGHREHGMEMRSGWPLAVSSIRQRNDADNNLIFESRFTNMLKHNYPQVGYDNLRQLVQEIQVPLEDFDPSLDAIVVDAVDRSELVSDPADAVRSLEEHATAIRSGAFEELDPES